MARINVKDLPQSADLDRKAMQAIVGGARTGVRPVDLSGVTMRGGRIVEYPPGFGRDPYGPVTADRTAPQLSLRA